MSIFILRWCWWGCTNVAGATTGNIHIGSIGRNRARRSRVETATSANGDVRWCPTNRNDQMWCDEMNPPSQYHESSSRCMRIISCMHERRWRYQWLLASLTKIRRFVIPTHTESYSWLIRTHTIPIGSSNIPPSLSLHLRIIQESRFNRHPHILQLPLGAQSFAISLQVHRHHHHHKTGSVDEGSIYYSSVHNTEGHKNNENIIVSCWYCRLDYLESSSLLFCHFWSRSYYHIPCTSTLSFDDISTYFTMVLQATNIRQSCIDSIPSHYRFIT